MDVYLLEKSNCSTYAVLANDEASASESLVKAAQKMQDPPPGMPPTEIITDGYSARIFNKNTDGRIVSRQKYIISIECFDKEYTIYDEPTELI